MGNQVLSNNVIIEMLVNGIYYPVFCGKTMSYSQDQELVEITSVNSAYSREYVSGMSTASLNITGVTILDNSDNRIAITYLMNEQIRRAAQSMRIRMTDDDGGTLQIAFAALITNNTLSRAVGTYSQSSVSLTVTGTPQIGSVLPPPGLICPEEPLYLAVVAGETSVHSVLLETPGITILEVDRSGLQHNETTGTPGNLEFRYGGVDGFIYFDTTNPLNDGEIIYVLYML